MRKIKSPHTLKIQELLKRVADKRDSSLIPKPTPEQFNGDEDAYNEALELWRIEQDERVAQAALDNPRSTLTAREKANRVLRNCQKRRQEIEPVEDDDYDADDYDSKVDENYVRKYPFENYIDDHNPANDLDERPWAERFPYRESEKSKWLTSDEARKQHKTLCNMMDEFQRWGKMSPEEFKALMDKQESDHKARIEQQNLEDQESRQPKFNPRSIKTPLELATWKRQSEHFARLRGEIVDTPQLQTIKKPKRDIAFQLVDGFMFWEDGTACELPLPIGVRVYNASNPPNYRTDENEKRIPAGWRYDSFNFMWVRTQ